MYKGQFTPPQVWSYFLDLQDPQYEAYLALVHARFSTNTYPNWSRAHPNRLLAHNGEINTLRGNINLMRAREGVMRSKKFGADLNKLYPVIEPEMSDSGCVDNVLEFLVMAGGRSLPEAVMTMVPEAWQNNTLMPPLKRSYYRWSGCAMEPWDGPALLTFSDGRYIGAVLDRNGLRPSRFYLTKSGNVVMASEVGVIDVPSSDIVQKGRLRPGRMLLIDVQEKIMVRDEELKLSIAQMRPLDDWLKELFTLKDLKEAHQGEPPIGGPVTRRAVLLPDYEKSELSGRAKVLEDRRLALFAYTAETINLLVLPMVKEK